MDWQDLLRCIKTVFMKWNSKWYPWVFLVAAGTFVFFLPALKGEFLHWDDRVLFLQNPCYRGLSPSHWQWMCSTVMLGHWQPLSWLSYALDYKTWGMNPQGWHTANLLLHTVNAVLVYLLGLAFLRERPRRYAAAVLAALFWAVHPLRVEAVAWLSTRGYLLCGTFCLLTVLFYLKFGETRSVAADSCGCDRARSSRLFYLTALLCFAIATFTKGIGMMLPLVLLLIDWFPLRRITSVRTALFCAVEKVPFFIFSLLTGIAAFLAKKTDGGMASVEQYGLAERSGQALCSVWFYLLKIVSPRHLSPLYAGRPGVGAVIAALVLTAVAAISLFMFRRKVRSATAASGAFLLLIFPMLGFTQSGAQIFADRFTYLAAIPFSILLGAGLAELRIMRKTVYGTMAVLLLVFGVQTFVYSAVWRNDLTLWYHAIAQDENNAKAYGGAGEALVSCQAHEKAMEYLNKALLLQPDYAHALQNRALIQMETGEYEKAFADVNKALVLEKKSQISREKMLIVRGQAAENLNRPEQALADYSAVIDGPMVVPFLKVTALKARARLYLEKGDEAESAADLEAVLKLPDPDGEQWRRIRLILTEIKKIPAESSPGIFLLYPITD
jgi:hypothetical protein